MIRPRHTVVFLGLEIYVTILVVEIFPRTIYLVEVDVREVPGERRRCFALARCSTRAKNLMNSARVKVTFTS